MSMPEHMALLSQRTAQDAPVDCWESRMEALDSGKPAQVVIVMVIGRKPSGFKNIGGFLEWAGILSEL